MKRKWEEPSIQIQEFIPNEYVAVCWGVACDVVKANNWEETHHNTEGVSHDSSHCGTLGNQWLVDNNNDGVPESMQEIKTDGLGTLDCTIYDGEAYGPQKDISTVKVGDYIYWTTSSGTRTWYHQGRVGETSPGHPNRS